MGYTHYWNFTKNPKDIKNGDKKFAKAVEMITAGISKYLKDIKLAGGNGSGDPVFTDTKVVFNGSADKDEDYETCYFALDNPDSFEFDFCKTARMPYDPVVCFALLCFKDAFGDDFDYSSDGYITDDGWKKANEVFDKIRISNAD